jgi:hypothetical protein
MTPELEEQLHQTLKAIRVHHWRGVLLGPRRKRPVVTTHWIITDDLAQIERHVRQGGNSGLLTHADTELAVLDADNLPAFADMIDDLGQPAAAWVETGRARLHYYVRWTGDLPAKLTWRGEVVGEILRGPGQQMVVCPPSTHPDTGAPYRWLLNPVTQPLEPLPGDWLAYLRGLTYGASLRRGR